MGKNIKKEKNNYPMDRYINKLDFDNPDKVSELYNKGIVKPTKPIVIFGIWIILFVAIIMSVFIFRLFINELITDFSNSVIALPVILFIIIILVVSILSALKSTKNYLTVRKKSGKNK